MTQPRASKTKQGMHPRNLHREGYDFPALVRTCPELAPFVAVNEHGSSA